MEKEFKFKFWVKSSRMFSAFGEKTYCWDGEAMPEDVIKDNLIDWCREVFPMFDFTDAFVDYGYELIK
jgi:hypothetical protein